MDAQTTALLAGSVREALTRPDPVAALAELGWDEVLADDPAAATRMLFTEHGRALVGSRLLDTVVLAALGAPSGSRAVLYPDPMLPAGAAGAAGPVGEAGGDGGDSGDGLAGIVLGPLVGVDELVVPTAAGDVLAVATAGLTAEPVAAFDRDLAWHRVTGPVADPRTVATGRWPDAVAAARRALAAEMIGVAEAALRLARDHTAARTQFGRPIASFQAVRHRLAEAHVALCAAGAVLDAAQADGGGWTALVAKAEAGRAQETVSRHVAQVCGAIGLSEEHPLHRHISRGAVLDTLLGGHRTLEPAIGRALLRGGDLLRGEELPRVVEVR